MTEARKILYPTVYSVIFEEYNKATKLVTRAIVTLKNAKAKKKKLAEAMRELGYPMTESKE